MKTSVSKSHSSFVEVPFFFLFSKESGKSTLQEIKKSYSRNDLLLEKYVTALLT